MRRVAVSNKHVVAVATLLVALAAGMVAGSAVAAEAGGTPTAPVTQGE
ncbi:hypothetical protein [Cellulomonas soli]|uniref:Uncharacterized protein n=1 Tax=Cellulomonas soli TaxID=931535 RepID=A0A512PET2_9CELL|nr:hypothetical protein [Cellulomonas soli]NYI59487.1 hypothetical protein [Cellulomonas soli]GEP69721.1 hypothetical protein CSO01_24360 [Cellulomonas soli]